MADTIGLSLPPAPTPPPPAPSPHPLNSVLLEIVHSETEYVSALTSLVDLHHHLQSIPGAISVDAERAIFSNSETLLGIHRELLSRLRNDATEASIAETFVCMAPFLKAYSQYCSDFPRAQQTLEEHRGELSPLEAALQDSERTAGQPLGSLLIKPVQRICKYDRACSPITPVSTFWQQHACKHWVVVGSPRSLHAACGACTCRYPLLLRELIKAVPEHDPAYSSIARACAALEEMATIINERVREVEGMATLSRLATSVGMADLVTPGRVRRDEMGTCLRPASCTLLLLGDIWAVGHVLTTHALLWPCACLHTHSRRY